MIYVAANNRAVAEAYARSHGVDDANDVVQVTSLNTLTGRKGITVHAIIGHIDAEIETMLYILGVRRLANVVYKNLTQ